MQSIIIEGGKRLRGEVTISGAKNAALPLLCSAILAAGESKFTNVPALKDVSTMAELLRQLGAKVECADGSCSIDATKITSEEAPYELVKTMRASVLVLGPLVARHGKAKVSLPGGCAIGARPINLHLMGLEKMGAKVEIEHGYVVAKAKRLKGARIYFDTVTVTGTENLMMAAALADGTTVLENSACEPEVVDLADCLNKMGAKVRGAGTPTITIDGVTKLKPADHAVMPDRIETGTFLLAGAITGGDVTVRKTLPITSEALLVKLRETGMEVEQGPDWVRIKGVRRPKSVDVRTHPYPGFATDMQAQFMAMMCVADGLSVITETVFENRFMHIAELHRMGADIKVQGNSAVVTGIPHLLGAPVMATDLRASASLIIAGLAAKGTTELSRVYHIDRGYERVEEKLQALGARIKRVG
ncbi:MAG: UDP-N-acetylglucosamine 1-carboxyvinyltransferase [Nitrospirae bacterium]|nr:UDP-N-acetylglucosamine 1-carboxyvinyltransferase [Nitrospirota bacterium]